MGVKDADGHKLGLHPGRVADWLRYKDRPVPLHAEIGITNRCNHHCTFCTLDWITHGKKTLASHIVGQAVEDMKNMGVSLSTNGQRYTKEMAEATLRSLSWIRFSLDTIHPSVYKLLHGVDAKALAKVLQNIAHATEIKMSRELKVDIGVQAIVTKETLPGIFDFVEYMRALKVDNVQLKPCHHHPNSKVEHEPFDPRHYAWLAKELEQFETDDFKVVVRSMTMERLQEPRTYKRCHGFDFYILINADGDVVPCNVFYNKKDFIYGNLYDSTFKEIWTSKRRKEIIKNLEDSNHSMCGDYRCRFDVMNRYLERISNPERNDEFI
jgi:radical SAM protein with 4Fe4S-binding SPASM domain